ncbi:hypothetical protein BH10PLA2_BH10PLA2_22910 [soil metagenome]
MTQPKIGRDTSIFSVVYSTEHVDRLEQGFYQVYLQHLADFTTLSAQAGSLLSSQSHPRTPFRSVEATVLSSDEFLSNAAGNGQNFQGTNRKLIRQGGLVGHM